MELTVTPFKHQQEYIKFALAGNFTLCGDEMGLGKTLSAIGVACAMNARTLVVCPAFLKHNWRAEFLKFTDLKESEILVIEKKSDFLRAYEFKVVIVNYEKLKECVSIWQDFPYVIADECHYLKNIQAKRTQYFHNMVKFKRPERLSLLSGTAVKNRVEEFYSLLVLLSYVPTRGANGLSITDKFRTQYKFSKQFSYERTFEVSGRTISKFEGLRNEAELKSYFRGKYMRRLTKQVIDLPELLERYVEVNYKFDDKELKNYEEFTGKMDGHIMAIKSGSASAKAPFTADYAKNIHDETGLPVVIFSDHVDSVRIISEKLKSCAAITGATKMEDRHAYVTAFQQGKLDYIVATIGAMSTGVTLTAAADLIFNDMSYVPANNAQASKRIHRIGQTKTCRIHKICGSFVDKGIMTSLTSKQKVLDAIL